MKWMMILGVIAAVAGSVLCGMVADCQLRAGAVWSAAVALFGTVWYAVCGVVIMYRMVVDGRRR